MSIRLEGFAENEPLKNKNNSNNDNKNSPRGFIMPPGGGFPNPADIMNMLFGGVQNMVDDDDDDEEYAVTNKRADLSDILTTASQHLSSDNRDIPGKDETLNQLNKFIIELSRFETFNDTVNIKPNTDKLNPNHLLISSFQTSSNDIGNVNFQTLSDKDFIFVHPTGLPLEALNNMTLIAHSSKFVLYSVEVKYNNREFNNIYVASFKDEILNTNVLYIPVYGNALVVDENEQWISFTTELPEGFSSAKSFDIMNVTLTDSDYSNFTIDYFDVNVSISMNSNGDIRLGRAVVKDKYIDHEDVKFFYTNNGISEDIKGFDLVFSFDNITNITRKFKLFLNQMLLDNPSAIIDSGMFKLEPLEYVSYSNTIKVFIKDDVVQILNNIL